MPDRFGNITIQPGSPTAPAIEEIKTPPPVNPEKAGKGKKRKLPRKHKASLIWLSAILGIFGLYNAIGFLGVPYYLSHALPDDFKSSTGMTFHPGKISFNPLTFRFSISQAQIITETGSTLASLNSLTTDLAPLSLLRMDFVSKTVTLTELALNITREKDGSYNFDKLIRQKQEGLASEILNFSDLPFLFSLNNIAIKDSRVLFLDSPTGKTHTIEKIQLSLPTFSNFPFHASKYLRPSFSAVINGSPVELAGQAHMDDSAGESSTLTCSIHSLDLPVYAEYLPFNFPLLFTGGKADGKINLLFDPTSQQEDKLSIDFALQLTDTEMQAGDETVFVTAPATEVRGTIKPVAKTINFSSISFNQPVLQSVGNSLLHSLEPLFKKEKTDPQSGTGSASPSFSLSIEELLVDNGIFHLWKKSGDKQPTATWNRLQLNIKNYTSATTAEKETGSFVLSGGTEGDSSTFTWQGDLSSVDKLSGKVAVNKIGFRELLLSLGADQDLAVKGLAELKGLLTLSFPKAPNSAVGYKLSDAELTVQDFQLIDDNLTILSSPAMKISSLATAYKTIHFGNVSLQNSSVSLPANRIPETLKLFTTGKYIIHGIDFSGQLTVVHNEKAKQKQTYTGISIKAKNLDTPEKAKDNFSISAKTAAGGVIQGQGDVRVIPFSLTINTEFTNLAATDTFKMISDSEFLHGVHASVSGKGTFSLPKKSFSGDLQFGKGNVRKGQDPLFSWSDVSIQGVSYTSQPFHLGIVSTSLNQPQFSWKISENDPGPLQNLASFFQQIFPKPAEEKQQDEQSKIAISPVDIQEIQVHQANVLIQDNRLKPKWKGDVSDFSGNIKDIHLSVSADDSVFQFSGKIQDIPFTLAGTLGVFHKEQKGSYRLDLTSYPLSAFHEQLAPQTDINTKNGFFDLQLHFTAKDGRLQNSGHMIFSGVKPMSEKSDSALALALLTNEEAKFRLDFDFPRPVPLGKSVFMDEILAIFQTQVVKASVSPLLLASGDFTDLIGNEFAEFEPGQPILTDKGREILSRYATLLVTHPQLGLELASEVDKEIDAPALKELLEAQEQHRVQLENQKRYETWLKEKAVFEQKIAERQKKLASQGKTADSAMPPAVLRDYIPAQPKQVVVDDVILLDLAKKRNLMLSQYLVEQLSIQSNRFALVPLKKVSAPVSAQPANVARISFFAIK